MTAVLIGNEPHGSRGWHGLRSQGIGGSEIAAVVGLSPYESAFSLWHKRKGNIPGTVSTEVMSWGNRHEPTIADYFGELHPDYELHEAGTYAHKDRPWQLANVDRLLNRRENLRNRALLEIKTSRFGKDFGPTNSDQIPLHYRCQVQWYLDVLGLPYAWVAVLIGGNEYREYVIDADPVDQAMLREAGAAFWASLQTDDEPPLDASFETFEAVRALHPDIDGSDVDIPVDLYGDYLVAQNAARIANDEARLVKSKVLAAMGDARRATAGNVPVLRRQPGRNGAVSLYPIKEAS